MEDDLISKKELLELMDISYGQLYRWKRKGLIPEEWFIRKSTYTGQETFFPKGRVLQRIERIKNMKDDISLDDLADVFSPDLEEVSLKPDELERRGIITGEVLNIYRQYREGLQDFGFNDILTAFILGRLITAGDIGLDEGRQLLDVMGEGLIKFKGEASEVYLLRKLGVFSCFMLSPPCRICLDKGSKLIARININAVIEELKLKLI
jgi:DNA-binding transcriptional MerR regulator